MSTTWAVKETPSLVPGLSEKLEFNPIILQILAARNVLTPEAITHFLKANLLNLADPFLLPGMDGACRRIFQAVREGQTIMLHGDYDVDGVTSAAIMALVLKELSARFVTYIPERKSGYGFNETGVRFALNNSVNVILTLDCGITSHEEISEARKAGIDTVVVDHHQIPPEGAPLEATAIVNPWLDEEGCEKFLELSAAGLAFKLAAALLGETAHQWVDIAAVGTVADVADLVGENRLIVKAGLELLGERSNLGIKALLKAASLKSKKITPRHVGFIIGPRLNAGGRMDTATEAFQLLISTDEKEAERLADILERKNSERRATEKQMLQEAFAKCDREFNFNREKVIVLWSENWHPGVIGIVAARLVDRYYRPAVVISLVQGYGKGSARSIRGFNVYQGLKAVCHHLKEFGGHEFAAGFTIDEKELLSFRAAINCYAEDALNPANLLRPVDIDVEISLAEITVEFADQLTLLSPFGYGNPEPVFLTKNLKLKQAPKSQNRFSTELWVTDGQRVFRVNARTELCEKIEADDIFDLAYSVALDDWEGRQTVSLEARDIRPSKLS